ncbi:MAG: hypothetical protein QOD42_3129 [Sphingomonadales bacterium]|jgi:hypothetical protein|nr:hypothetical protein [Sphingomonadales bacterium]
MSIKSNAFGRVELSGDDARKFRAQATYGRPKKEAKFSVVRGATMVRELQSSGAIKLKLKGFA